MDNEEQDDSDNLGEQPLPGSSRIGPAFNNDTQYRSFSRRICFEDDDDDEEYHDNECDDEDDDEDDDDDDIIDCTGARATSSYYESVDNNRSSKFIIGSKPSRSNELVLLQTEPHKNTSENQGERKVQRDLDKNMASIRDIKASVPCHHCNRKFSDADALTRHLYQILGVVVENEGNKSYSNDDEEANETQAKITSVGEEAKGEVVEMAVIEAVCGEISPEDAVTNETEANPGDSQAKEVDIVPFLKTKDVTPNFLFAQKIEDEALEKNVIVEEFVNRTEAIVTVTQGAIARDTASRAVVREKNTESNINVAQESVAKGAQAKCASSEKGVSKELAAKESVATEAEVGVASNKDSPAKKSVAKETEDRATVAIEKTAKGVVAKVATKEATAQKAEDKEAAARETAVTEDTAIETIARKLATQEASTNEAATKDNTATKTTKEAASRELESQKATSNEKEAEEAAVCVIATEKAFKETALKISPGIETASREQLANEEAAVKEANSSKTAPREQTPNDVTAKDAAAPDAGAHVAAALERINKEATAREEKMKEVAARELVSRTNEIKVAAAREVCTELSLKEAMARNTVTKEAVDREAAAKELSLKEAMARETAAKKPYREIAAREEATKDAVERETVAREKAANKATACEIAAREEVAFRETAVKETAARNAVSQEEAAKEASVKDTMAREITEAASTEAMARGLAKDAATREAARELSVKEVMARETAAHEGTIKEIATRVEVTKDAATKERAAIKLSLKKAMTRETAAKQPAVREIATEDAVESEAVARENASKEEAIMKTTANEIAAREEAAFRETAAKEAVARTAASQEKAVKEASAKNTMGTENAAKESATTEAVARTGVAKDPAERETTARETAAKETVDGNVVTLEEVTKEAKEMAAEKAAAREAAEEIETSDESAVEESVDMSFQCLICACIFKMKSTFLHHLDFNHNITGSCPMQFKIPTPTYTLNFKCPYCGSNTSSIKAYNAHIKKKHSNLFMKFKSNTKNTAASETGVNKAAAKESSVEEVVAEDAATEVEEAEDAAAGEEAAEEAAAEDATDENAVAEDAAVEKAAEERENTSDESFNEESAAESLCTSDGSYVDENDDPSLLCPICAVIFKTPNSLLDHLRFNHGIKGSRAMKLKIYPPKHYFSCPHCKINFSSFYCRNAHIKRQHYNLFMKNMSDTNKVVGGERVTKEGPAEEAAVEEAVAEEAAEKSENTSDKSFNEGSAAESHNSSDESDVEEAVDTGIQCSICGSIFKMDMYILKHLKLNHGIKESRAMKFKSSTSINNTDCPHCEITTSSFRCRNAHIKAKHFNVFMKNVSKPKKREAKEAAAQEAASKQEAARKAAEENENTSDESFNEESAAESLCPSDESDDEEALDKSFQCSICASVFKMEFTMLRHLHLNHGIKESCGKKFRIPASNNNFRCPHCGVNTSSINSHNAHIKRKHYNICKKNTSDSMSHKCSICMKVFSKYSSARTHRKMYHPEMYNQQIFIKQTEEPSEANKSFQCTICKGVFDNYNAARYHRTKYHPDTKVFKPVIRRLSLNQENQPASSQVETKPVSSKRPYPNHEQININVKKPNVMNEEQLFDDAASHSDVKIKLWFCDSCECFYTNNKHIEWGMPACKKVKIKKYICTRCGLYFTSKMLRKHQNMHKERNVTLQDYTFINCTDSSEIIPKPPEYPKCSRCKVHFLSKTDVTLHNCGGDARGDKSIICGDCNQRFWPSAYKLHAQFHMYEKRVDENQSQDNNVSQETKTLPIHSSIVYSCSDCGIFTDKYNHAVEHSQNHLNDIVDVNKTFVKTCTICDMEFEPTAYANHRTLHKNNFTLTINKKSFTILTYNYKNLVRGNWLKLFSGLPKKYKHTILSRSMYNATPNVRMKSLRGGSVTTLFYKCAKCKIYIDKNLVYHHTHSGNCSIQDNDEKAIEIGRQSKIILFNHEYDTEFNKMLKLDDQSDSNQIQNQHNVPSNETNQVYDKGTVPKRAPAMKVYKCKCGLHFTSLVSIEKHIVTCPNKKIQSSNCSKCNILFPIDILVNHLIKHHQRNDMEVVEYYVPKRRKVQLYACARCSLLFTHEGDALNHKDCGTNIGSNCRDCNLKFHTDSFKAHECTDYVQNYIITVNDIERFNTANREPENDSLDRTLFKSAMSDIHYLNMESWFYHFQKGHNPDHVVACDLCTLKFMDADIINHKKIHHQDNTDDYLTVKVVGSHKVTELKVLKQPKVITNKNTNRKGNVSRSEKSKLKRNMSRDDDNVLYKCNQCPQHFPSRFDWIRHICYLKNHYATVKECSGCQYTFNQHALYKHESKHHKKMNLQRDDFRVVHYTGGDLADLSDDEVPERRSRFIFDADESEDDECRTVTSSTKTS